MSNTTTTITKTPAAEMVWMVDYSAPVIETESHDAIKLQTRDRDGKFAPKFEKPVTKRQAVRGLSKASSKRAAAMDLLDEMEAW